MLVGVRRSRSLPCRLRMARGVRGVCRRVSTSHTMRQQVCKSFFFFLVGDRVLKWVRDRGDKLRLVNTSTAIGTRTWCARIEVSPGVGIISHCSGKRVEVLFRLVVVGLGRDTSSARCVWHAGQDGTVVVVETVTCPTGVAASRRRTSFVSMDGVRDVSEGRIHGWLPSGKVSNETVTQGHPRRSLYARC